MSKHQGELQTKKDDSEAFDEIAKLVQRTPLSIEIKITELEKPRRQPTFHNLPKSKQRIIQEDIDLLKEWQEAYDRDALTWRYGQPLDQSVWTASTQPTLRIVEVEFEAGLLPSGTQNARTAWRDVINAADATWIDLAAQVCEQDSSLILYTDEDPKDPYGARRIALRSALKRHRGSAVPRGRLRLVTPDVLAQLELSCPDVILLHEPERWSPQTVQALKARTVIVVVPSLPRPTAKSRTSGNRARRALEDELLVQGPFWQPLAPLDRETQENYLREFGQGRVVDRRTQHGIPNTSKTEARIDWPALQHLPASGQVVVANELLLLRAAVWYQLSTGLKPTVPDPDILTQAAVTAATGLPLSEKIRQRLLRDLQSHRPTDNSNLSLVVSDKQRTEYIGR